MIEVILVWSSSLPYFLQFKSEFCNKEFVVCATVSSWSCFCWLYRASPFSAGKNIITLFSVLTIWWCHSIFSIDHLVMSMGTVFSCVVGRGCLLWSVCSLGKTLLTFALLRLMLDIDFLGKYLLITWKKFYFHLLSIFIKNNCWILCNAFSVSMRW